MILKKRMHDYNTYSSLFILFIRILVKARNRFTKWKELLGTFSMRKLSN